jgi:hypothetical protein
MPDLGLKRYLKVLTNEKRGGLRIVLFDKSVQAPSCERHKTTQQTLFCYLQTIIVSQ